MQNEIKNCKYSIIVSLFNKEENIEIIEKKLSNIFENFEIIYIANKEQKEIINAKMCIFDNNIHEDEALNKVIPEINGENLIVVKNKFNLANISDIESLKKSLEKGNNISLFKREDNSKINLYFKNLISRINKKIFGFKYLEGETSVIAFSKSPTLTLRALTNASVFIKIDKWINQKIDYVPKDIEKTRQETSYKKPVINLISLFMFLVLIITSWALLPFLQKITMSVLLTLLVLIVTLIILIIFSRIYTKSKVGDFHNSQREYFIKIKNEKGE